MKIQLSWDEYYPFAFMSKLENLNLIKMTWLSFYDIPDDKYNWIKDTYKELDKVKAYLGNIEHLRLKAKE